MQQKVTVVDGVRHWVGSGLVPGSKLDNQKAVIALRSAKTLAEHQEIMDIIKAARNRHRVWLFMTQRQWQSHQRSVTPRTCAIRKARWGNRHDDATILRCEQESVATREKYVRCS